MSNVSALLFFYMKVCLEDFNSCTHTHLHGESVKASLIVKIFLLKVSGFAHTQVKNHQCLGSKVPITSASLHTVPISFYFYFPLQQPKWAILSPLSRIIQSITLVMFVLRSYFYTYKIKKKVL